MTEKKAGKYTYLLVNFGVLILGRFGTKILSMLLTPLYTGILTTEEYGIFDLFNTTLCFIMPILTLNISAAVLRFALDPDSDTRDTLTVGVRFVAGSNLAVWALLVLNHRFRLIPAIDDYVGYFALLYFADSLMDLTTHFFRGLERVKDTAIAGVIGALVMIGCNLVCMLPLNMGLRGYLLGMLLGNLSQSAYMILRSRMWRYLHFGSPQRTLRRGMLKYSVPLVVNTIAWWVNEVSDRYVVSFVCGVAANGIYSVASKIPSIMAIITRTFNKAWTISAVKDYDSQDQSGFFSQMYNLYQFVMVLLCSGLIAVSRLMSALLFSGDFFVAWRYVQFLLIAMMFSAICGYLEGIFSAVKASKICSRATVAGAAVNLIFNLLLVPRFGPMAAAVMTAVSYWLVWEIQIRAVRRFISLRLFLLRDYCAYAVLIAQSLALLRFSEESIPLYLGQAAMIGLICLLFRKELRLLLKTILSKRKR